MIYNFDTHTTLRIIYNGAFNRLFRCRFSNDICLKSPQPHFILTFVQKLKSEQYFSQKAKKEPRFKALYNILYSKVVVCFLIIYNSALECVYIFSFMTKQNSINRNQRFVSFTGGYFFA